MNQDEQNALLVLRASKDSYLRVLASLAYLHEKKDADYGRADVQLKDYFPFGLMSYVQMIWIKALRLRSLVAVQGIAANEPVVDTLQDLANYAIFALIDEDK